MKRKHYIFILLIGLAQFLSAQVEFTAKVSKKKLGINERLRVDFIMNEEGDNFNPPSFSGFKVVGGPSQSVSHSWVNGKRSFSKTYSYVLSPKQRGNFTIGQASIEIKGNAYKTIPIKVQVTAAVSKPKDANDPSYVANENIHLVAEISNSTPYLNEAITVVYKLYVGPYVNVSNYNIVDNPKYSDFWSQNIDIKQLRIQRGTYQGQDYNYVVMRKTVLYPQKTGKLTLEPLTMDVAVDVPTNRRDFFGGRVYQTVQQKVAAGKKSIQVKALPSVGKPESFTGAVGDFQLDVTTTKTALKAGESLQAQVKVSGKGNLGLFELPSLVVPSSLEVYEPEHKENIRTNLSGMSGSVSDTYTLVPQYKGNYPISKLEFSFFNPKTKNYQTVRSIEHVVEVLTGPTNTNGSGTTTATTSKEQNVIAANSSFRSFHTTAQLTLIHQVSFFRSKLFWSLLITPLLIIPVVIAITKRKQKRAKDVIGSKQRNADKLAKKYLSAAKKNLNSKELFYESLHKSLHNYLKAKLGIETSDFSKEKIREVFATHEIAAETTEQFINLKENCELARFTPISHDAMQQDYNRSVQVITAIDKTL